MSETMGRVEITGETAMVTFERRLVAPVTAVWEALTDPGRVGRWLAPAEMALEPGGAVRLDFGGDGTVHGRITELDPPRLLGYTWLMEGEIESMVRWALEPEGEATLLRLVHHTLPSAMASGYGAGWHAHLDQLVAVVTGAPVPGWDDRFSALIAGYR